MAPSPTYTFTSELEGQRAALIWNTPPGLLACVSVFGEGGVSSLSGLKGPFRFNIAPEGRGTSGGVLPCVPALSGALASSSALPGHPVVPAEAWHSC